MDLADLIRELRQVQATHRMTFKTNVTCIAVSGDGVALSVVEERIIIKEDK